MTTYLKRAEPQRPQDKTRIEETVRGIIDSIRDQGDEAVHRLARELDKWDEDEFRVSPDVIRKATAALPETFKQDFEYCREQVCTFARHQRESMQEFEIETEPGIHLGQKLIPVSTVGCYVPGGKYPLVASAIMSVSTAREAGVDRVIACAPPRGPEGIFAPTLYGLHAAGADEIYVLGGAQAMASMAYGRVGMPEADMIVGAGNPFVAEAKRQLFGKVGIDLLAGPTEILIIADDSADPALVATDLLGQAEHGPDSPAWLVTTSDWLGRETISEVQRQLETLPTAEVASQSWAAHGEVIVVTNDDEAIAVSDSYAPEHLEVMTARNDYYLENLCNYGSLFLGEESTVAYGDKGVGTNHTLPTGRAARYTGGLWVGKFIKTLTYQRLTPEASRRIAPVMARQCEVEGMMAHKITADVRSKRYAPEE